MSAVLFLFLLILLLGFIDFFFAMYLANKRKTLLFSGRVFYIKDIFIWDCFLLVAAVEPEQERGQAGWLEHRL